MLEIESDAESHRESVYNIMWKTEISNLNAFLFSSQHQQQQQQPKRNLRPRSDNEEWENK